MINSNDRSSLKSKVLVLKEAGYTVSEVAEKLTLPRSTVWDWFNDRKRNNTEYPIAYVNDNLTVQRAGRSSIDIEAFLEQLAPIELPDIFISNPKKELSNYVIVLNDLHFPLHCQKSIDIALTVIDELKPKSIIINGDSLDMLAISRFPKDIRTQYNLLEERIEYHKFLYSLIEISNGSEIIEVHGNHSGD